MSSDRRTHEGHMDWEYNGTGPVDVTSPFARHFLHRNTSSENNSTDSAHSFSQPGNSSTPTPLGSFGNASNSGFFAKSSTPNPFAPSTTAPSSFASTSAFGTPNVLSPSKPSPFPRPGTASVSTPQQNPFATPAKPAFPLSHTPSFTSRLQGQSAPPFRNPAFTTPRQSIENSRYDDQSGPESSPAYTETGSDFTPDTPEQTDGYDDRVMSPASPSRINRKHRYTRSGHRSSKRHLPGRGEIMHAPKEILRRRRRFQPPSTAVTVGGRYGGFDSEVSEYETDEDISAYLGPVTQVSPSKRSPRKKKSSPVDDDDDGPGEKRGWIRGMLRTIEDHPNAPENFRRWLQVAFNTIICSVFLVFAFQLVNTVKSDLMSAHAEARSKTLNEIQECTQNYRENRCGRDPVPYLKDKCTEWDICMSRDAEAVMSIRVMVREIALIVNDFSGTMSWGSWGFLFGLLFVTFIAMNTALLAGSSRSSPPAAAPVVSQAASSGLATAAASTPDQGYLYYPQTPSVRRRHPHFVPQHLLDEGMFAEEDEEMDDRDVSDSDGTPLASAMIPPYHHPSGSSFSSSSSSSRKAIMPPSSSTPLQRSPTKLRGERMYSLSPTKRSPTKYY